MTQTRWKTANTQQFVVWFANLTYNIRQAVIFGREVSAGVMKCRRKLSQSHCPLSYWQDVTQWVKASVLARQLAQVAQWLLVVTPSQALSLVVVLAQFVTKQTTVNNFSAVSRGFNLSQGRGHKVASLFVCLTHRAGKYV